MNEMTRRFDILGNMLSYQEVDEITAADYQSIYWLRMSLYFPKCETIPLRKKNLQAHTRYLHNQKNMNQQKITRVSFACENTVKPAVFKGRVRKFCKAKSVASAAARQKNRSVVSKSYQTPDSCRIKEAALESYTCLFPTPQHKS